MKISHGSRQLSLGRQDGRTERVVFDTGSSYTYFPKEAYYALVASVSSLILSRMKRSWIISSQAVLLVLLII